MAAALRPAGTAGMDRREQLALAALLALAAAVRVVEWTTSVALFNDGPRFLGLAHAAAAGDYAALVTHPFHPLYPLLVAGLHALGLGWETAAVAIGVAGGTAAVGFVYAFVRDAFGGPAAWVAAALLAAHGRAVEFSSDVQSDGLYLGLFAGGVWLLWRAWVRRSPTLAVAAGLLAGLAYLTRPEGLLLAVVGIGLALLTWLRGGWRLGRLLAWCSALALATAACVAPYAVAIHEHTGAWTLTRKKSVRRIAGLAADSTPFGISERAPPSPGGGGAAPIPTVQPLFAPLPPAAAARVEGRHDLGEDGRAVERAAPGPERVREALRMLLRTAVSAFRLAPLLLLIPGLWLVRGRPSRRGVFVLAILGTHAVLLFGLTHQLGYVSRRHLLPPLLPLLGYAGLGTLVLGQAVAQVASWGVGAGRPPRSAGTVVAAAITLAAGVGELATQRGPRRAEERAAREAAEWLHAHAEPGPLVTTRLRLGYYAGMPYVPLVRTDDSSLAALLAEADARYVLLDDPEDIAAVRRAAGPELRPLHRVREGGREAWVFERQPAAVRRPSP